MGFSKDVLNCEIASPYAISPKDREGLPVVGLILFGVLNISSLRLFPYERKSMSVFKYVCFNNIHIFEAAFFVNLLRVLRDHFEYILKFKSLAVDNWYQTLPLAIFIIMRFSLLNLIYYLI